MSHSATRIGTRILLVEDNPTVRERTAEVLLCEGRKVVTCETAEAALAAFERDSFDVVITDVSLPVMSGVELARRVTTMSPDTWVVISSGYTLPMGSEKIGSRVRMLPKPFESEQLEALLTDIEAVGTETTDVDGAGSSANREMANRLTTKVAPLATRADSPHALQEAAFQALVTARLQRSYLHELRNGLQTIHGGMDALCRAMRNPDLHATAERAADLVKQGLATHGQSLEQVMHEMLIQDASPATVDVGQVVRDVVRFVRNEGVMHNVTIQSASADDLWARVRISKLRLALLGLIVQAIDSSEAGGSLLITASLRNDGPTIEVSRTPAASKTSTSLASGRLASAVIPRLIEDDGGALTFEPATNDWRVATVMYFS